MITYRFISQVFLGQPIKVQYSKYSSNTRIDLGSGTFPFEYTTDQKGGTYYFYIPSIDRTFTKTIEIPPIDIFINTINVPDCDISGMIESVPSCDVGAGIIEVPVCDIDYGFALVSPTPTPTNSVACPSISGVTVGPIEISGGQEYTLADNPTSTYFYQFNTSNEFVANIPPFTNSILPDSLFADEIMVLVPSPYWIGGPCQYCFNINLGIEVPCVTTPTPTPTNTMTPTPSSTESITTTPTPTNTNTPTPSVTENITPTVTPTNTETPTMTPTPSSTESIATTPTPTITSTPTTSVTGSLTPTPTITPTIPICFNFINTFYLTNPYTESRLFNDPINGYILSIGDTSNIISIIDDGGEIQFISNSDTVFDLVFNENYQLLYAIGDSSLTIYNISSSTYTLNSSVPLSNPGVGDYDYNNEYLAITTNNLTSIYDVYGSFVSSGVTTGTASEIVYDPNYSSYLGVPTFILVNNNLLEIVTYSGGTVNVEKTYNITGVTAAVYNPNNGYLITNQQSTGNIRVIDVINEVVISTVSASTPTFHSSLSLDISNNILYTVSEPFIYKFNMSTNTFICLTDIDGSNSYGLSSLRYSPSYASIYVGYTNPPLGTGISVYSP